MEKLVLKEQAHWQPRWDIDKFLDPGDRISSLSQRGVSIDRLNRMFARQYLGRSRFKGNLLLNSGINVAWGLICGAGGTAFDNTHAFIQVGDSSASPSDATKTGIQAASNKLSKGMNATYPLAAAAQAEVWQSTFATSEANYAWNEIAVSNANDYTHALNRLVAAMGTKASGATWIVTLTITLS
ncbi:MAG: hypothetical protein WB643_03385 [Candidatus Bathyarchaeia archaeon]